MFIKSLIIKNFRSFDVTGIKVDFNDDSTVFIGRNGSGKTSILEALNMLIGQDYLPNKITEKDFHCNATNIKDEIFIEGETEDPFFVSVEIISNEKPTAYTVLVPCKIIRLTIKRRQKAEKILDDPFIINKMCIPIEGLISESLYDSLEIAKSKYGLLSLEKVQGQITDIEEARDVINDLMTGVVINNEKFNGISGDFYNVQFKLKSLKNEIRTASFPAYSLTFNPGRIKNSPKSYYLKKERGDDISGSYSFISKILTDLHWRWKHKTSKIAQDQNNVGEKYDNMAHELRSVVDEKGALIRAINKKVEKICSDDKDLQFDFIDLDQPYKSAFISKIENGKFLLPENLGSGYNILIAYALFSYIVEQEKTPIVFIIDEPELHLHTDWQRKMYDIFTEDKNLQIVYSTQSENFISIKYWEQIRLARDSVIYPKKEVADSEISATDGESGTPSQFLEDYAKRNLHVSLILRENLELFFTKKCILVEGPGEKYSLPKILKLVKCDIDSFSVSVISAWGKTKLKNYQMICKYFGIEYYTIFDGDKKDDIEPENENEAIRNNAQDGNIFEFSTSFENKLGISGEQKFQKLVKIVDELSDASNLDKEIKTCVDNLKIFIER